MKFYRNSTVKNTNYTPLNNQGFKTAAVVAKSKAKGYIQAVQELALSCIYFARANNESRKSDMVFSLLDKAHQRKFVEFITNHSSLVFVTAKHRADYKKKTGKQWDVSRHFYVSKTVNSGDDTVRQDALDYVANIVPILWVDYKAPRKKDVKPYDTLGNLNKLLKRMDSKTYGPSNELDAKQMNALKTFMHAIENGLTLDDIVQKARKDQSILVPATIVPDLVDDTKEKAA